MSRRGEPRAPAVTCGNPGEPPGAGGGPPLQALDTLFRETVFLFHRMGAAAEAVHRERRIRGGERGILRSLHRHGPQTVPQLARARPVSRQHIQAHVTPLAAKGLVEFRTNPVHRKSHLVALTEKGRALIEEIDRTEKRLLSALPLRVAPGEIEEAASLLRAVRVALESEDWNHIVAQGERKREEKKGRRDGK